MSAAPPPSGRTTSAPQDTARWVLPVLAVVGAAVVAVAALSDPVRVLAGLGTGTATVALFLAVLSPFALIAARGRPDAARALLVAAALVLVSWVSLTLPRVGVFADLEWNWQGKLLDLAWVSVLFLVLRDWARREAGLRLGTEPGSLRRAAKFTAAAFTVAFVVVLLTSTPDPAGHVSAERLLFDSTIPNLTEELIWRGAILAVLDRALGTPWRFFGAPVGWGLVLTAAGFGLGHGLAVEASGIAFDPGSILLTGVAGLALGWVRAITGSVWPAFVAHCAPELGMLAALAFGDAVPL